MAARRQTALRHAADGMAADGMAAGGRRQAARRHGGKAARRHLAAAERDVVVELELLRERLVELEARAVEDVRIHDALRLLLQLLQPRRAAPVLPLALPHARSCALSAEAGGAQGGRERVTNGQRRTNTYSSHPDIGPSELWSGWRCARGDGVHAGSGSG